MKKFIFALLSLPSVLFAKDIDSVMKQLNLQLNPKIIGEVGYEIEYRVDRDYAWVNIQRVVLKEWERENFYLKDGKITSKTETKLETMGDSHENGYPLYQIICERGVGAEKCKRALAKELTVSVVKEIVNKKIRDVILKVK